MIQVAFHAAHIGVQPWQGDDGTQGRAIVITDNGVVVTVPLDEAACSEIAAALTGGIVVAHGSGSADIDPRSYEHPDNAAYRPSIRKERRP